MVLAGLARSFNNRVGAGGEGDDGDTRHGRCGHGGEVLTVQPPADDRTSCAACYVRHWAAGGLLVALGKRRGS